MTDLSQSALEGVLVDLRKMMDSRDVKIQVGPTMILMIPYLYETALEFAKRCDKAKAMLEYLDANKETK